LRSSDSDRVVKPPTDDVHGRVANPSDRREQRGADAEDARLERRVERVVLPASREVEMRERVHLRVRQARARELPGRRVALEDPIAPLGDDLAVGSSDHRADGDRPAAMRLPRKLERAPPRSAELVPGSDKIHD